MVHVKIAARPRLIPAANRPNRDRMSADAPPSPAAPAAWPDLAGRLTDDGRGHVLPVRIYYEDTDFSGVVYHASHLRFFERGRTDFLRLLGIGHAALAAGDHGEALAFAVGRIAVDYRAAARIDDVVEVETRLVEVGGARIVLDQRLVRGAALVAAARVTVALVGPDGRARRLPAALRQALLAGAA